MSTIAYIPRDSLLQGSQIWSLITFLALAYAVKWMISLSSHERKRKERSCLPPRKYPHTDKILGSDLLLKCTKALNNHSFLRETQDWMYSVGHTFEYLVLGNKAVITLDPLNLQTILSTQFRDFGLGKPRLDSLHPVLGNGIFNSEGDTWHNSRTILRQHASRSHDEELAIFERNFQLLTKHIPTDGASVDVQQIFTWFTMDTATEIFLGASSNVLASTEDQNKGQAFSNAFNSVLAYASGTDDINVSALIKRLFSKGDFESNLHLIDGYVQELIIKARQKQSTSERYTYLDALIEKSTPMDMIKKDLLNVLTAASDSTKTLLSNIWFVLARRPDVFENLKREVAELNGQIPTARQLEDLTYLRYVIKETLRLYPPVALNQRTAYCDTTLPRGAGDHGNTPMFVSKGTSVGYSTYALHRVKDIYGLDAEEFRPERWENLKPGWAYLPFHGGPRKCLGQRLATTQVSFVTVRLMQQFSGVENRDSRPWTEAIGLNCSSRHGVQVAFSR